jgi:polysaccharide export outer membrane protein
MVERNVKASRASLLLCCVALIAAPQNHAKAESLLIGPGDQLHIQVFATPDLEQHPRVTDAGDVPLMLLGNIRVTGLTPAQAAATIEKDLVAGNFMLHPQVTVTVEQYATQSVAVLGEVKQPGTFPITAPRSIFDMIALAGGLTGIADRSITIERKSDPGQKTQFFFSNNSNDAIDHGVLVYPGDKVLVPKAGLVYVLGDVRSPGGYVMSNNSSQLTVLQMVAAAGGTNHSAVPSHARLIRRDGSGVVTDKPLSLSAMQKGKQPDLALQAGDIVYVPFSYIRNVAAQSSGVVAAATQATIYTLP